MNKLAILCFEMVRINHSGTGAWCIFVAETERFYLNHRKIKWSFRNRTVMMSCYFIKFEGIFCGRCGVFLFPACYFGAPVQMLGLGWGDSLTEPILINAVLQIWGVDHWEPCTKMCSKVQVRCKVSFELEISQLWLKGGNLCASLQNIYDFIKLVCLEHIATCRLTNN